MSLTAFVTGANGFLGSNLVRELDRQGWETTVIVRPTSLLDDIQDIPLKIHQGDIVDVTSVHEAMPRDVDAVFHVAASTNVWAGNNDEQNRINIDGTRNMIEAAITARAGRFIHTSSFTTWGFLEGDINENSPRSRNSDWINYVRSKRIAEDLVKKAVSEQKFEAVILNPGHILGPGDRHNWSRMVKMVATDTLPALPPGGGAFADVREVAKAHITAFHKGENGEHYLLGGDDYSFAEVIGLVGEILGKETPKKPTPSWALRTIAHFNAAVASITRKPPKITPESAAMICHHMRCQSTRAKAVLGYRHTPIRPLVEDTVNWMRQAGLLK
ncbi:MAG TPA: SDR family oxidoreductase [Xanthomonadales bacterium]|nr:SDR family oxidoreductase [Xanthomonadales bacterium]